MILKYFLIFLVLILLIVAGWYFLSPLIITDEVNEEFPIGNIKIPMEEELALMAPEDRELLRIELEEKAAMMPVVISREPMPVMEDNKNVEPNLINEGNFRNADSFHKGTGLAGIYELGDKSNILRFTDFMVTNGPDLRVYLVGEQNPQSSNDVSKKFIELGKLKGNVGNQNYVIPEGTDLSQFKSVVIYCKPFKVIFSVASLN